jgi:CDP-4-dehydro-6-deoxyglucose reductase
MREEQGLSDVERAAGWILSCARAPASDVTLDVGETIEIQLPKVQTLPCRIQSLEKMTPDVIRVVLRLPPTIEFAFLPGQYIDVIGPGGTKRSYSLANADASEKRLEMHIKAVRDGKFSSYWFGQAKENDLLRLHGPLGTFFLRNIEGKDLLFLATGTGIAPVKAMLESLSKLSPGERPASVMIYWGGRARQDLYWDPATVAGGHQFIPVLSRPDPKWVGATGYIQDAVLAERSDFSNIIVYACGSENMIRTARASLGKAGLPEQRFVSDAFVSS